MVRSDRGNDCNSFSSPNIRKPIVSSTTRKWNLSKGFVDSLPSENQRSRLDKDINIYFEGVIHEILLMLLLSLPEEDILRQTGCTNKGRNLLKTLALEKIDRKSY